MVFQIKSCKLCLEYSFFLMIAFALLVKANNLLLLLLFSALHECGHLFTLLCFGGRPERITVSFYGVGLKHKTRLPAGREAVFLLAGAAVNLFFSLLNVYREINLPLFIVNMLPILPLDGGRAVSILIKPVTMKRISAITLLILASFAIFSKNLSLILITAYIFIYSYFEG